MTPNPVQNPNRLNGEPIGSLAGRPARVRGWTLTTAQRDWMMLQSYLHLEQRKPDAACVILRVLFRLFPDDVEVQRCLALGELMSGRPVDAARVATRALQKSADDLRMPVGLVFAKALWEQGKHEAAREFLTSLLTTSTD